jgi:EAL domain-containing protein (putative c-di-GMP-specific phosphodiesterase class I)
MAYTINFRLTIDSSLLRDIETLVAREGISINALVTELLEDRVKKEQDYEQAKRRALARMRKGFDLGGRPFSRDEIYER